MRYKVKIRDKAHSIEMQQWAFQNGYSWGSGYQKIQFENEKYMYFNGNVISYGSLLTTFLDMDYIEIYNPLNSIQETYYEIY